MTDREMLELAAKAAGMDLSGWDWSIYGGFCRGRYDDYERWNPLEDDGDALRLAVKLGLEIERNAAGTKVFVGIVDGVYEELGTDPYAATRRAIVRAAAEIGKSM